MPRQDVPYGGAICRLKERIAEIWDELGKKLHSINGVEGDGAGDVKIVSGDPAVVITSDQANHQIEVALDSSQLPAASVSSVNGQTGAVVLDAGDIPSNGNSDVQSDIDALQTMDGSLQGNINAEALARQHADSALQTNINAVSASLPAAAAAAVAADPTVAYINSELTNKVDLSDVSTVETPDTIAKRNGSGRLVAADPASGATDKTLVTANWISQTGNSAPNNVMHRYGAETIYGAKKADSAINGFLSNSTTDNNGDGTSGRYKVILKFPLDESYGSRNHILFGVTTRQRARSFDLLSLYIATRTPQDLTMVIRANTENYTYVLSYDSDFGYVSIITNNSLSDSIQTLIIGGTQGLYNRFPLCTAADIFGSPPGTEIRRLTP